MTERKYVVNRKSKGEYVAHIDCDSERDNRMTYTTEKDLEEYNPPKKPRKAAKERAEEYVDHYWPALKGGNK